MPAGRMTGKSVIVTGGAQGMGLACAKRIVAEGGRVVLADLNGTVAEQAASAIAGSGGAALAVACDVTKAEAVAALVAETAERFGAIDALICCAGGGHMVEFLEETPEQFAFDLSVNLIGTFLPCQAVARHMVRAKTKGALVTVSSTQSVVASANLPGYAAAKAGVSGLTRAMAVALGPHAIRVNSVAPGPMRTPMLEAGVPPGSALERVHLSRTPLGRFADPAEMASAAVYLASDDASFVTGQTLFVDGGRTVLAFVMPDTASSN